MPTLLGFSLQIPPIWEEICQGYRGYWGCICLPKLQQSGGIINIKCVLDGSSLLDKSSGRTMVSTSTCSSSSFFSTSVIWHCLSVLRPTRTFTSSYMYKGHRWPSWLSSSIYHIVTSSWWHRLGRTSFWDSEISSGNHMTPEGTVSYIDLLFVMVFLLTASYLPVSIFLTET